MKVKVIQKFLDIPINSIGEIIEATRRTSAVEIKFDCKDAPVWIQYPLTPFCVEIGEPNDPT